MTIELSDVTAQYESALTNGRHVAVRASGGGGPIDIGTSALGAELVSGGTGHGEQLRIKTDGSYDFGTKNTQTPKHWEFGNEVFINGVSQSQAAVGGNPPLSNWESWKNAVLTDHRLRHQRVSTQWTSGLGEGTGKLLWSKAFNGRDSYADPGGHKFYVSFWVWTGCNYFRSKLIQPDTITGTFQYPREGVRGEVCDVTDGASTWNAYVCGILNGIMTLDFDIQGDDGLPNAELSSALTITGQSSGATADVPSNSDVATTRSTKYLRVWQKDSREPGPHTTITPLTSANGGQFDVGGIDSNNNQVFVDSITELGFPAENPEEWNLLEYAADYSSGSGTMWVWMDGALLHKKSNIDSSALNSNGFRMTEVGMDLPGVNPFSGTDVSFTADFGEVYGDSDSKRLYIYKGTDFNSSGKNRELIRHTSFAQDSVDVVINQGALDISSGYKIALVDGETVIFDQLEVS